MKHWYMLAIVGKDTSGIVAKVTDAIFQLGGNLGEASMTRLGESFAMMLMVNYEGKQENLDAALKPVAETFNLQVHIDPIEGGLHHHLEPNVAIRVFGADKAGIVAQVTHIMAEQQLNITSLETEVAGTEDAPLYIMLIEAYSQVEFAALQKKMQPLKDSGFDINVSELDVVLA